jgi:hypothetical protein
MNYYSMEQKTRSQSNQSLFWYGLLASLKVIFGVFIILIGMIGSVILLATSHSILAIIVMSGSLGFGLYFGLKGNAQRFDYQRRSGIIVHQGGWR